MNRFLILVFLFYIGCSIGWCIEVFFRRFYSNGLKKGEKKWINPGFLVGPYLPIYGFGLCTLFLLAGLEKYSFLGNETVNKLVLFLVMAVCMTVIEYIAGVIFIKGMNLKLWDYSDEKFNYQGIICLKFSIFWAMLGATYYFMIHPYILEALEWFARNLTFSFILGAFFGVFALDVCYSFQLSAKIRKFATDNNVVIRYEELKMNIRNNVEDRKEKYKFMFAFSSRVPMKEHLVKYLELRQAFEKKSLLEKDKRDKK